eukprot:TRINITY_DN29416_c0_g2_i1.p1 TRINITY_DN29416_c0_g2~~TRINITY_DN29416_c0_g2_i1.p1  ORF type:complete len:256 (+),score=73.18 TRINITY_DN29416_c0_g2_i1:168-935(+)
MCIRDRSTGVASHERLTAELEATEDEILGADRAQWEQEHGFAQRRANNNASASHEIVAAFGKGNAKRQGAGAYERSAARAVLAERLARRKLERVEEHLMLCEARRSLELRRCVLQQAAQDELALAQAEVEAEELEDELAEAGLERQSLELELENASAERAATQAMAEAARAAAIADEEFEVEQRSQRSALEKKLEERSRAAAMSRKMTAEAERVAVLAAIEKLGENGEALSADGLRLLEAAERVVEQLSMALIDR